MTLAFSLSLWVLLLLMLPVRRAFPMLMAEASRKLQVECDVPGFLATMEVLRSRKHLPRDRYLLIEANYAIGLDADGRTDEAMARLRACRPVRDAVQPPMRYQFDMAYACVCAHAEEGKQELPGLLAMLEHGYATLPFAPPVRDMIRRNLDNLQDIARYYSEAYDGLVERFVSRIEGYRRIPSQRRSMLLACFWLARIYEKLGRLQDALSMYRYVVENGNTLGIVSLSGASVARLTAQV